MSEKPILFSTEMVKAILDGRKTMTRRIVKPQPELFYVHGKQQDMINPNKVAFKAMVNGGADKLILPKYQPGDILWVRETWYQRPNSGGHICYKASPETWHRSSVDNTYANSPWKPSIHMPRAVARLFLRVTNVRVERLQDITEDDTIAEGIKRKGPFYCGNTCNEEATFFTTKEAFIALWNSLNHKRGYGWEKSSWVWVIEFEVIPHETM